MTSDAFEEVSWDDALGEIAARLGGLIDAGRAHDILTAHYTGTCSVIANQFPMRFFNHIGATEVNPDSICNLSGHVALGYVLGESATGFDPRTAKASTCADRLPRIRRKRPPCQQTLARRISRHVDCHRPHPDTDGGAGRYSRALSRHRCDTGFRHDACAEGHGISR